MKKIIFGILVSILMLGSVITGSTSVINIEQTEKIAIFEDGEITTSISIGSYEIENTDQGDIVSIEDFGRLIIPGKPNLPTKIFAIAIPPGAEYVDLTYETGEGIDIIGDYYVTPVPLPRVIGEEDPAVVKKELQIYNENYEVTYNSDEIYPKSIVEFECTAGFRKYNLVDVRVNPITYQPLSGKLTYYPDITVHVNYEFPEGFDSTEIMFDEVASFEQRASEFILNHEATKDWYPTAPSGRESYNYVIITLDSLTSYINDLVDWEESKGRSVYVATTDWINSNYNGYDLQEKMRNFLRDKYPSDEWGIEFVCLIGTVDDVPIRLTAQNTGYGRPDTDFYFAELSQPDSSSWDVDGDHQYGENSDPIDFYAEVYVGRIPWSDSSTVESICAKTVAYEQNNDDSFKKNILLLGAFFWPDTDNAVLMEAKVDHDWMDDWTMTSMYELGQSSYPMDYNLDYNNVLNVWSTNTFAFVNWAGHGSPTACYEYYPSQAFVDTDTCNYLNDDYPAIIFADACSNSDTDYDNIGKMMLEQGGVGFLGSTKVAYGMPGWTGPTSGSSQTLDYYFTTGCTEGLITMGQSHQEALRIMYENNYWYYQKFEHFEWGAIWGNPDLTMGVVVTSEPPTIPEIDGPTAGVPNEELTFIAMSTDPEDESLYYMFDWGNGEDSGWLGPNASGTTIEAKYTYPEIGVFEVRAKAKDINHVPSDDWSDIIVCTVGNNSAPDKPTIDGPTMAQGGKTLDFTFKTIDPEGHDVYYYILWGDGDIQEYDGPHPSGEVITYHHRYSSKGTYTIICKAKDEFEAKSRQSSFKIQILRNKGITNPVVLRILENLLSQFPFLQQILLGL
jgi:hypothetical protein